MARDCGERSQRRREQSSKCDDIISGLPDDILGTIISLLPTKDGGRTPAISRRWRPLWRTAPLNLEVNCALGDNFREQASVVSKILAEHHGPARRFVSHSILLTDEQGHARVDGWFRSLTNLQELEVSFTHGRLPLPEKDRALASSLLRLASTLVVAKIEFFSFSKVIVPSSSNFPHLKDLTLQYVTLSEEFLHGLVCGCRALESLLLWNIVVPGSRLRISSPTLRTVGWTIGLRACDRRAELVIEDAPRLERLLPVGARTLRITGAPKLEVLGPLLPCAKLFQGAIRVSLANSVPTVKILALGSGARLNVVLDVLKCFPCLEKLYVNLRMQNISRMGVEHASQYDKVECLGTHLKEVVLMNYDGSEQDLGFAKFFILNAAVLQKIEFGVPETYSDEWNAIQESLLQVGASNRASRDADFEFKWDLGNSIDYSCIYDLSSADPFGRWCYTRGDAPLEEADP